MSGSKAFTNAVTNQPPHWLINAIGSVRQTDERFARQKVLDRVLYSYQELNKEMANLDKQDFAEIVFVNNKPEDYASRMSRLVDSWNQNKTAPSMTAIAYQAFDYWGVNIGSPDNEEEEHFIRAILVNAVLADIEHDKPYHGNPHFRDVSVDYLHLAARSNFDKKKMMRGFWAVVKHDTGHFGRIGNLDNGNHVPLLEEQNSMNLTRPYEEAAGIPNNLIAASQLLVFSTDVSGSREFEGSGSPAEYVYALYDHHYKGAPFPDLSAFSEIVKEKMSPYINNPEALEMARYLQAADLFASVGRGFDSAILNAARHSAELVIRDENYKPEVAIVDPEREIGFRKLGFVLRLFDLPVMQGFKNVNDKIFCQLQKAAKNGLHFKLRLADNVVQKESRPTIT